MKLKEIGAEFFVNDYDLNYEEVVRKVREKTQSEPQDDEVKILKYLKSASSESIRLSEPFDLFTRESLDYNLTEIYTDGVWEWSGLLAYYVEKYHYLVDAEFVEHMKKNNWKIPKLS